MLKEIIIFCDGAAKGNPGPGGCGAVVVLPEGEVVELGGGEKHTTNNRMELLGAIKALSKVVKRKDDILVYTDSKYLINGVTSWIYSWQKNNWQTKAKEKVLNQDLWKKLVKLVSLNHKNDRPRKIEWHYVGGHIGVAGNERCDEIASSQATGGKVKLYKGLLSEYKINILDLGHDEIKKTVKHGKSAKAYSYLSLVGGILNIDKTWPDCEVRVKGKAGARYKKAISPEDEKEIIKSWGLHE